jgi:hypothetical protein
LHKASTKNTAPWEKIALPGLLGPERIEPGIIPPFVSSFWGCLLNPTTFPSILPSTSPPFLFYLKGKE